MTVKPKNVAKAIPGNSAIDGKRVSLTHRKLVIILALVAFILYANTFTNDYAYDDISVITKNAIVTKGITAIPEILSTPYRYGFFKTNNDLYRPLPLVMFAIEYQLFDGKPFAGHFMNVLFFACCVVLLFIVLNDLFGHKYTLAAFIAALLFALHPMHTEVVANIKSCDELMCFFCAFLSLHLFIRYAGGGKVKLLVVGAACYFLSLLSKETSITFLAVIPLVFFFYKNDNKKRSLYITICVMLAAVFFLVIRFMVLKAYNTDHTFDVKFIDNPLIGAPSTVSRQATAVLVLGKYLLLLLIPYPLICDYSYSSIPFTSFANIWVLLSLMGYITIAITGIYRLIKFPKDPYALGILFFLITLALFSNLLFLTGAIMAERFVFFASAGFCLVAAFIIARLLPKFQFEDLEKALINKKLLAIFIPVALVFAVITITRNNDWANSLTLYRADIKNNPGDARLYYFLGNELLLTGTTEADAAKREQMATEAIDDLKHALAIYPAYGDAHRVMGNGYFFLSRLDSAELYYRKAAELDTGDMEALNNLDVVYFNEKAYNASIGTCKKIIQKDPGDIGKYNNIGICYIRLARYDSAVYFLKKGVLANSSINAFYEHLALAYKMDNKVDSARKYEAIARQHHPGFSVY